MIDYQKSAELNHCTIDELKSRFERFPGSRKPIIDVCIDCGLERKSCLRDTSDRCHSCANTIKNKSLDMRKKVSDKAIDRWSDPAERESARLRGIEQFSDPKQREDVSIRKIKFFSDQRNRDLLSRTMKDSDIHKAASDKMCGGHDIIRHHFIYDHNNPGQHTIKITRSEHQTHHQWMKRNGLKVPHLNMTEDNKDMFKKGWY